MPFSVVLDTYVLYPAHLRDTLLRLAERGLYRVLWSKDIINELQRNLNKASINPTDVEHLIAEMEAAFPDASVIGHQALINAMSSPPPYAQMPPPSSHSTRVTSPHRASTRTKSTSSTLKISFSTY